MSVRKDIEELPRHERCRRHGVSRHGTHRCHPDGDVSHLFPRGESVPLDVTKCEACELFTSRYIEFPLELEDIEVEEFKHRRPLGHDHGTLVRVRPCDERYEGKTYVGILVAEAPTGATVAYDRDTKTLTVKQGLCNPLILIPETRSLVWGYESWWAEIESVEELREITDGEIENSWYMGLMRAVASALEEGV